MFSHRLFEGGEKEAEGRIHSGVRKKGERVR
jgi:hypothetical protein